jgi:hypothetical protein
MVIVRLMGGLGNQMFQYAAGRGVAHRNRASLKLDVSAFERDLARSYKLDHFNIAASIANPDQIARFSANNLWGRILRRLERHLLPPSKRSRFAQRLDHFDPDMLQLSGSVYLEGYWQSERYFQDIQQIIRQDFTFRHAPDAENQKMAHVIVSTNAVSLHIRRGDYVSNPRFSRKFGTCSLQYYQSAVTRVAAKVRDPCFFVFSDDIDWARDNLRLQYPVTFVAHNGADRDYEDLRLMSLCKHHIIANSSFSWWGAWLCAYPEKMVIAPNAWFRIPGRDTQDLIPGSWHRV